jgi:hypothetical protein
VASIVKPPKAVAIQITPETSCVNFRMSSRSSVALPAHRQRSPVRFQRQTLGRLALPCLVLNRPWHAMPLQYSSHENDWDEGPRGARSLRLARKQMWKRRKLSEVGLDPSEGRSDPLVTCKCRRAPRVKPGRGSITTVRVSVVAIRRHPQGGVRLIAVRLTVPFFHSSTTTPIRPLPLLPPASPGQTVRRVLLQYYCICVLPT